MNAEPVEMTTVTALDCDPVVTSLKQSLKPLLWSVKLAGLYRDGPMSYIIYSGIVLLLIILSVVRYYFAMADIEVGLNPLFIWTITGMLGTIQLLLTFVVYIYHNIKGTQALLVAKIDKMTADSNYFKSLRGQKMMKRIVFYAWISLIPNCSLYAVVAYLVKDSVSRLILYPGGHGNYFIDALILVYNLIQIIIVLFTAIFNMTLVAILATMFQDLKAKLTKYVQDNSITTNILEECREGFHDLCDLVNDVDQLLAPLLGLTIGIQTGALIFMSYGMVYLGESFSSLYVIASGWACISITVISVFTIGPAYLSQTVSYTCYCSMVLYMYLS